MSSDSFTEVTSQSWGSRIKNSIGGIFFGFILIVISIVLMFWNEGRSVKRAKALDEGAKAVISVSSYEVDAGNEGELVHLTGIINTDEELSDPVFGVSANAVRLSRKVRMYQWKESSTSKSRKKMGGSTTKRTEYTYKKVWSEKLIDSSDFKKSEGHNNPGDMPYEGRNYNAKDVKMDAFTLSSSLIRKINNFEPLDVDSSTLPLDMADKLKDHDGGYYSGDDPMDPEVGDVKITFRVIVPLETVSLVAKQTGGTFSPYMTEVNNEIELLKAGSFDAVEMFEMAKAENATLTWILRGVGFLLMFFGFLMILSPLSVLADVIPFLGDLVGMGTGLVAFLLAVLISFVTIAIAWFVYRPLLSIFLIIAAMVPFGSAIFLKEGKAKEV